MSDQLPPLRKFGETSAVKKPGGLDRVFASWELNVPNGPQVKGGGFYDVTYPVDENGIDTIKEEAAERVTNMMKPMALQAGNIMPDLPPGFVTILMIVPATQHTLQ